MSEYTQQIYQQRIKRLGGKEGYAKYFREWRAKNRKKSRAYNKAYNKMWRIKDGYKRESAYALKWSKLHPKKRKAQIKVRYALKKGHIKKLLCKVCGSKNVVAHHPNYNKPLKIVWLCKVHHRQVHYGIRK